MSSENKKSDAEEILEEFQKTHDVENPQTEHSKLEPERWTLSLETVHGNLNGYCPV